MEPFFVAEVKPCFSGLENFSPYCGVNFPATLRDSSSAMLESSSSELLDPEDFDTFRRQSTFIVFFSDIVSLIPVGFRRAFSRFVVVVCLTEVLLL